MSKDIFKTLTPEEKQYITQIFYDEDLKYREKMEKLAPKFGVSGRTIRRWWKERLNLTENPSKLPKQLQEAQNRSISEDTNILLITTAQNKTGVNMKVLGGIKCYKDFLIEKGFKPEIVVAPARYRNPTSPSEYMMTGQKVEEWWRDEVNEFLHYGKIQFGDTLISSDSRVRPTAKEPLTGYEVLSKDNHLIIPHSKIHFKTLPRFKNDPLRVMCTTGFVTNKNYSDSKAGDQAHEHHSYGFVIVELKEDGTCHIPRNVKVTSEGHFTDIIYEVKDNKVSIIESSEGFVWGDIHARVLDTYIFEETLKLCNMLKPKIQVLHDVYDGSTVNPHEKKDMFIQRQKILKGQHLIDEEIQESFDIIGKVKDNVLNSKVYVSVSNHDIFLDRLINDENWKRDLHNSPAYLKYALIQQTVDLSLYGGIYGYLLSEKFKEDDVKYINYGESLKICSYESGSHGDCGANGSRGNYQAFSRLNTKMIHGHSHSPVIKNSVTVVGVTCKLDQYYTRKGLSSWAHAHSVVHNNCKNQLLVFGDDGKISSLI